jgi:hypothetical protein
MSSLAFLVTELQVWPVYTHQLSWRYACDSILTTFISPLSHWPARPGENILKYGRCVAYIRVLHLSEDEQLMSLGLPLDDQAAEKSLAILRASPEQATANLAAGAFP